MATYCGIHALTPKRQISIECMDSCDLWLKLLNRPMGTTQLTYRLRTKTIEPTGMTPLVLYTKHQRVCVFVRVSAVVSPRTVIARTSGCLQNDRRAHGTSLEVVSSKNIQPITSGGRKTKNLHTHMLIILVGKTFDPPQSVHVRCTYLWLGATLNPSLTLNP
jgi:hypothetical protein